MKKTSDIKTKRQSVRKAFEKFWIKSISQDYQKSIYTVAG